jgi:2Fe-2S type ferredoxin
LPGGGVVKNTDGRVVWDPRRYDFIKLDGDAPDSVNPSLWRQAQLLSLTGLFQVMDRIYQVRGYDASNITFIEGKDGVTVVDPLASRETAKAALDLYYQHRPRKPVVAVIHTHSHVDHYGGVRGVVSEADVKGGKVKVIAPEHFTAELVSENVLAGNAMNRRMRYMLGSLLSPGPKGQASSGPGLTMSGGAVTFIPPTDSVTRTGQKLTIDGLTDEFQMASGTEAPAEMHFFIHEYRALCPAENATHTLHNLYTLRGAKVRQDSGTLLILSIKELKPSPNPTPDREVPTTVADDQYLLDAAAEAGLELPYMYLQGWCLTCAGRILAGEVDQSESRRFYPQDAVAGFVLLCSAYPRSDLRILTHQRDAMRDHRLAQGLPTPRG